MRRIGIIAAMPGELKPLVQGWKQLHASHGEAMWQGTMDETTCIAVCAGMGTGAAERACAMAAQQGALSALVSMGWAGALSCGMQPGSSYVVNEVVDASSGETFPASDPSHQQNPVSLKLVTLDHVAHPAEKRQLAEKFRAVLVDMEAATVARISRRQGIPFYCLKAVSDVATEKLPDFSAYTDHLGHLRLPALLAHVAIHPGYWPGLARVSKNTKTGAVAMAAALGPLVGGGQ
jgi:adenosylhomocysteine nucleosidase